MKPELKTKVKPKEVKTVKIKDIVTAQYIWVVIALTLLQVVVIFLPMNIWYTFILFMLNMLMFLMFKESIGESMKKKGFIFFKLSIPLFMMGSTSVFGKYLSGLSEKVGFTPIVILFHIATVVAAVSFTLDKDKNKIFENIYEANPIKKMSQKKAEKNPGDVELCVDSATNEPVILPFKDRFLHMLILGPTGSGKTSQILLPLINQDLQEDSYGVTIIEPKGDLAEKVAAMGRHYGKEVVYFNPTHENCPFFNPLYGPEDEVLENMATTFKMLNPDSPQFFQDMNETLIRNSLKVLKRVKGNSATLLDLSTLVYNAQGEGRKMINTFAKLSGDGTTVMMAKENAEIASWFISEYYNEKSSKTYEHCSGLRSQIAKITSNSHLRRVLNPPNGENDVNFEKIIEEGKILAISTAQGDLRDLGRFLGYFIILNFQSAVFKRPGNENTRRPHFLYIDEFQTYSNPGFADMLTQGRSYRVASHLATQNRALMAMNGGRDGNNFVELVSTNARNVIIFPGGNSKDAKYYSDEFGDHTYTANHKSTSTTKFNLLYGFQKIGYPSESIREEEVTEARFSHSDVIYNKFGEIIYRIVANNTVQTPGKGKVSWLPKDFNDEIDEKVREYDEQQRIGAVSDESDSEADGEMEQEIIYPDIASKQRVRIDSSNSETPIKRDATPIVSNVEDLVDVMSLEDEPVATKVEEPASIPIRKNKQPIVIDYDAEDDLI